MTREQRLFSAAKHFLELAPDGKTIAELRQPSSTPKASWLRALEDARTELSEAIAAYEGSAFPATTEGRLS